MTQARTSRIRRLTHALMARLTQQADTRVSGRWVAAISNLQVARALFQRVTPGALAAFFKAVALPGASAGAAGQ